MKVVVSDEGDEMINEINFIKLEILELDGLPSLTSFCAGNHNFKFPSLTKVVVNQCPKMEFFSKGVSSTSMLAGVQSTEDENREDWLGDLNSTMHFLYKKMVGFCGVQHLKVSEFSNLRDRWHNELPVEFLCDLESLVIDEVAFSSYAMPSNLLEYLNKLQDLSVTNCEVLEEVFDVRGLSAEHDILSRLNKFQLISLPRLRNIWNEHAQGMLNFKHLKSLKVHHCSSLKRISTPSMTQGLVQLQKMEVKYCNSVEEIITRGAANEVIKEIIFPLLQSIILESLPCLISFNSGREILKCPSLEEIAIVDCPTTFTCTFLRDLQSNPDDGISEPKVVFPNLKDLKLSNLVKIQKIWYNKQQLEISAFTENLTSLNIDGCGNLKHLFSTSMVKGFIHLKILEVCNCKFMEEIIHMENNGKIGEIVLRKLEFVKLRNLQQLSQFCTGNFIECVGLTMLWIEDCPELGAFISKSAISNNLNSTCSPEIVNSTLFDIKVDFPNLETLTISGVNGLKEIWDNELREDSFCKLKGLRVQDAKAVVKVFPPNVDWRRFQNLEELYIHDCDSLTEVFDIRALIDLNIERGGVIATQLRKLWVLETPNLEHIWNEDPKGILDFHNLSSVDIRGCPSLKSVVPASIARGLVHLERLCVVDSAIKEIVARDEERLQGGYVFHFPQLKVLILRRLPQLETFYPGTHTSEWPTLQTISIRQCYQFQHSALSFKKIIPNLMELALNSKEVKMIHEGQLPTELFRKLRVVDFNFFKMVGFRGLQYLKLSKFSNLIDRWHNELPGEFFCGLNSLVIDEVAFSSCAIPSNLLEYLNKLDKLEVTNCELLEEVFHQQGLSDDAEGQRVVLSMLKNLHLINLPKLSQVWNEHPRRILNFKHLKSLKVHNCCSLRMIFTPSMTQQLVQLQEIEVKNCHSVEEIISNGAEEDDTISFPQLNSLVLDSLPKLTVFRTGKGIVQCPSLEKITVMDCPNIEVLTSSADEDQEPIKSDGNSIFFGKVTCESLKELRVDWSNNMKKISDGESAATHDFFSSLKVLELKHIPTEYSIFPSRFLERSPNLEELIVSDSSFEELFSEEGTVNEEESSKKVTHLRRLTLSTLPLLRRLIKDRIELACSFVQHLEALEVFECNKITILAPSFISFRNLTTLKVSKCHGLLNLITSSTARSMTQLTRLEITECKMVEEIVVSEGDHEVEAEIGFSQLKHLQLHCLPKLTRFGSGNGTFNFPSLEEVIVRECPEMEIFVQGELSAPNLESVQTTEDENEWRWDGSLNATIQKLFEETVRYFHLQ